MYLPHIKNIAAFVILVAAIAANSMTIPLVKGNTWSYSYRKDTSGNNYTGLIHLSVDTVKRITDTTFFTLSYVDSGSLHGTSRIWLPDSQKYVQIDTIMQYLLQYQKPYRFFEDSVVELTTASSPGCNGSLLSFVKQRDTSYSWVNWAPGADHYEIKTERKYPVTINGTQDSLFYTIHSETHSHTGAGAAYYSSIGDTVSWVSSIGAISIIYNLSASNIGPMSNSNYLRIFYSLISFNDTPIPPLSQLSAKTTTPCRTAQYKTGLNRKIVALSGKGIRNEYFSQKGIFNLQGQKLGNFNRSQLIICRQRQ